MAGQTEEQLQTCFEEMDYTQRGRRRIADKILEKAIDNEDPEMLDKAMKALDGMDKNSLGRLKLNQKDQENKTNASNGEAMASLIIELSNQRTNGRRNNAPSNVGNTKLPDDRRPKYDDSVRDKTSGTENTREFNDRIEGKKA